MALEHDKDGFLVGTATNVDKSGYARALSVWQAIKADTTAIAKAVGVQTRELARARVATSQSVRSVAERAVHAQSQMVATPNRRSSSASMAKRGRGGRFVKNPDAEGKGGSSDVRDAAKELAKDLAAEMADVAEEFDPVVKAGKELKDTFAPLVKMGKLLGKGAQWAWGKAFGKSGGDSATQSVPWYRRIWRELRDLNKKGGLTSRLGGLFGGGGDGGLDVDVDLPGGRGRRGGRGGKWGWLKRLGKGAGRLGKGLLKRLPLIGGLVAGGMALSSIFGSDDPNKSAAENRKARFAGGGSGIGALVGGAVGLLGGPVGVVIGGIVGDIVGEKVGDWLSTVNWKDVGDKIVSTWTATTDWFKSTWAGAKKVLGVGGTTAADVRAGQSSTARGKQSFFGVNGGDALSAYGTYTPEEAATIRRLKGGKANTSASLKGGMPADIKAKIVAQAKANGLDPEMMLKMAAMESGGNANAISGTGAIGVYQFTGKTATGVGIKNRFNADENIAGGMKLTKQNIAALQKAGLPATPENIYMMHQLGPGAATEIIAGAQSGKSIAQLSAGTRGAVSKNYGAGSKTAAEYMAKNKAALEARYAATVATPAMPATTGAATAVASAPMLAVTKTAALPVDKLAPPPAPAERTTIASNDRGRGNTTVTVKKPPGQNLSDRSIAHVATGGVGSFGMRS